MMSGLCINGAPALDFRLGKKRVQALWLNGKQLWPTGDLKAAVIAMEVAADGTLVSIGSVPLEAEAAVQLCPDAVLAARDSAAFAIGQELTIGADAAMAALPAAAAAGEIGTQMTVEAQLRAPVKGDLEAQAAVVLEAAAEAQALAADPCEGEASHEIGAEAQANAAAATPGKGALALEFDSKTAVATVDVMPESAVSYGYNEELGAAYFGAEAPGFALKAGETYFAVVDGELYECAAKPLVMDGQVFGVYIGDEGPIRCFIEQREGAISFDGDYPFVVMTYPEGYLESLYNAQREITVTCRIYQKKALAIELSAGGAAAMAGAAAVELFGSSGTTVEVLPETEIPYYYDETFGCAVTELMLPLTAGRTYIVESSLGNFELTAQEAVFYGITFVYIGDYETLESYLEMIVAGGMSALRFGQYGFIFGWVPAELVCMAAINVQQDVTVNTRIYYIEHDTGIALTAGTPALMESVCQVEMAVEAMLDKEITRWFTANFYDGDTLLESQQLAHGETATPPEASKDGYIFVGWSSDHFVITQDTDFYAVWEEIPVVDILEKQTIAFTNQISSYGCYRTTITGSIGLVSGKTYIIEWDGTEYVCTARDIPAKMTVSSSNVLDITMENCCGDSKIVTKQYGYAVSTTEISTGEPFMINYSSGTFYLYTKSTAASHTVRIYEQA